MDPLRAGAVLALDDGLRYLCNDDCATQFRAGHRPHDRPPRHTPPAPRRDPTTGIFRTDQPVTPLRASQRAAKPFASPPVAWGIGLAALGAALALLSQLEGLLAYASAAASIAAAASALHASAPARSEIGLLPWLLGPLGAALAAVAAVAAGGAYLSLLGAAVAALAMVGRTWLDVRAGQPVAQALDHLERRLPELARTSLIRDDNPVELSFREVSSDEIRAGQTILVVEGETIPVDGLVKAGHGEVLLHPSATSPVPRHQGDPVLGGAQVTGGALHISATRVGPERALLRPNTFGRSGPTAARSIRRAQQITRIAGLVALGVGLLGTAFASDDALSVAAAVLLAAPLLSLRRAAELPLVAAGAAAVDRGIVFPSSATLERAGQASVAAVCGRGTVTEGRFQVAEAHAIADADLDEVIALAASAQSGAEAHPIAIAIRELARDRGARLVPVRRARSIPGRGVTALSDAGDAIVVGNRQLLLDEGVSVAVADAEAHRAEARGHTAIFIGIGGRIRAVLALSDSVRPGARAAIQRLFDLDMEVVLVSGDHRQTLEAVARKLDLTNLRAELTPEERATEVRRLGSPGQVVAAIGTIGTDDDMVDAAPVPILLRAAGNAGERSVAVASDDVQDAAAALFMAHASRRGSRRAITGTLAAGAILMLLAGGGLAPPAAAALLAVAVDAFVLPEGARILRRIELRVPHRG
ncbi:MAG: HAD family hydrolase [Myxococcota bacterium]